MTIKTGELSKRLGVHENTVRAWSDDFAAFMSPGALGAKRKFTEDDGLVLATIAQLRDKGLPFDKIRAALAAGQRADFLPPLPTEEEEAARSSVQLVPLPEYQRVLDALRTKESELSRVIDERDKALIAHDSAGREIANLREQIGELRGRLSALESERLPQRVVLQIILVGVVGFILLIAVLLLVQGGIR